MLSKLSNWIACVLGHRAALAVATLLFVALGLIGLAVHFSDTYMLITTFALSVLAILLLFPIQYSSNRDGIAIQKKLDEIIRVLDKADDGLIGLEKKEEP